MGGRGVGCWLFWRFSFLVLGYDSADAEEVCRMELKMRGGEEGGEGMEGGKVKGRGRLEGEDDG